MKIFEETLRKKGFRFEIPLKRRNDISEREVIAAFLDVHFYFVFFKGRTHVSCSISLSLRSSSKAWLFLSSSIARNFFPLKRIDEFSFESLLEKFDESLDGPIDRWLTNCVLVCIINSTGSLTKGRFLDRVSKEVRCSPSTGSVPNITHGIAARRTFCRTLHRFFFLSFGIAITFKTFPIPTKDSKGKKDVRSIYFEYSFNVKGRVTKKKSIIADSFHFSYLVKILERQIGRTVRRYDNRKLFPRWSIDGMDGERFLEIGIRLRSSRRCLRIIRFDTRRRGRAVSEFFDRLSPSRKRTAPRTFPYRLSSSSR